MADEYRNDNENTEENNSEETVSQEEAVKEGFCFEEQHSEGVDTSYRQPKPDEEQEQKEESFSSYKDAMQAKMEDMKNEPFPPVRKLSRKERRQLKKKQKNGKGKGKGIAIAAACVILLAGVAGGAYGVVHYIDHNFVKKNRFAFHS